MNIKLKLRILERFGCQADFAQTVGARESFVSRVVRGRREPGPEVKEAWAKALGCSIAEIFEEGDDRLAEN